MQLDYGQHLEKLNYFYVDFKVEAMIVESTIFCTIILRQELFILHVMLTLFMNFLIKFKILYLQERYFDVKNFHNYFCLVDKDENSSKLPFSKKQIKENN